MAQRQTTAPVSVIVVNWNRRELLAECLASLERQIDGEGKPFQAEWIIVDNGSTDGSVEMVSNRFPRAILIPNAQNLGYCAANNQGILRASGTLIALLNNDAVAEPDWLQQLQQTFENQPEVGMAASKILDYTDPTRIDKAGHVIYPDGQNRGRGTGERDLGQYDQPEDVLWPDGCAAMYRKAMLDQIGLFDEDLFAYGDDADLGFRGRIAGWRCRYAPAAVVRHRRGSTLGQGNPERVRLIERNRILLAIKLFPASLLLWNPVYFSLRMLSGLRAASAGQGDLGAFPGFGNKLRLAWALLRGQFGALVLLPATLRKRDAVNRTARLDPSARRRLILDNGISLSAVHGIPETREAR